MTCIPAEGTIESYSQVSVKFFCKSRVIDNMIFWTRNFAMIKENVVEFADMDAEGKMIITPYEYTCVFELNGKTDVSPFIHLQAKGICPTVKISHHVINFGECRVNERRDFLCTLDNRNEEHHVDYNFSSVYIFIRNFYSLDCAFQGQSKTRKTHASADDLADFLL